MRAAHEEQVFNIGFLFREEQEEQEVDFNIGNLFAEPEPIAPAQPIEENLYLADLFLEPIEEVQVDN